jgi:hypothetical protein
VSERSVRQDGDTGGDRPGHVFITRGDLTRLACAAWLLPGNHDDGPGTRDQWLRSVPELASQFEPSSKPGESRLRATAPVTGCSRIWRLRRAGEVAPQVYLLNSGGDEKKGINWYLEGLNEFLSTIRLDRDQLVHCGPRRERPLIGVPMFGTGEGGADLTRGGVVQAIYERLAEELSTTDLRVDFALMTYTAPDFAAAQWARRRSDTDAPAWKALGSPLLDRCRDLAAKALAGQLVVFAGAGVSAGAGLPLWSALLRQLAERAGMDADYVERLDHSLPAPLDQAELISMKLRDQKKNLGEIVAELTRSDRPSLSHTLLVTLPVREIVTTNYDELLEQASADIDEPAAQLPYQPDPSRLRWILKLHGTVSNSSQIVLTRNDYLSYGERRAALAGIVQGLLITKHMLFVGFSFSDDNFHRIIHDVRNAMEPAGAKVRRNRQFGTAVMIDDNMFQRELWEEDLTFVTTAESEEEPFEVAARRLEIFLDRVVADASTSYPYLLNSVYDQLLNDRERRLRDDLTEFIKRHRDTDVSSVPAWARVQELISDLGGGDQP